MPSSQWILDLLPAHLLQVGGCDEELTESDVEAGEVDQLSARLTNTVVQVSPCDKPVVGSC